MQSSADNLNIVFRADLIASMFVFSTPLVFAGIGGMFSERSGVVNIGLEGMMLMGAFFGVYGADKGGSWVVGLLAAMLAGGLAGARARVLLDPPARRPDRRAASRSTSSRSASPATSSSTSTTARTCPSASRRSRTCTIPYVEDWRFLGPAIGDLNLMVWLSFLLVIVSYFVVFKTPIGLRIRACGEHPRAADTVGINVYAIRYGSVVLSGDPRRRSAARTSRSASAAARSPTT